MRVGRNPTKAIGDVSAVLLENRAVRVRVLAITAAILLATLGCTGEPPRASASTATGKTNGMASVPAVPPRTALAATTGSVWRLPPDFRPPFAQRQELFVPPDRSVAMKTARQVGDTRLVLKGFADFEGRRVLLEINDSVVCLREGEERQGITIVAINPPQVTLRHQGRQWTETLLRASTSEAK